MMEYRIVEKFGYHFSIQYKGWFFWHDLIDENFVALFNSYEEAVIILDEIKALDSEIDREEINDLLKKQIDKGHGLGRKVPSTSFMKDYMSRDPIPSDAEIILDGLNALTDKTGKLTKIFDNEIKDKLDGLAFAEMDKIKRRRQHVDRGHGLGRKVPSTSFIKDYMKSDPVPSDAEIIDPFIESLKEQYNDPYVGKYRILENDFGKYKAQILLNDRWFDHGKIISPYYGTFVPFIFDTKEEAIESVKNRISKNPSLANWRPV